MALHCNWRDSQAWREEGLPFSTTNNEAAKMFDATLTQYVGWYDDKSVGGIEGSCTKMMEADPNFIMGHVLSNGLELMGTARSPRLDPTFQQALDTLADLGAKAELTDRERKHVEGIKTLGKGNLVEASAIWEEILVDHPTDMLAVKFSHDSGFYTGRQAQMRDSVCRVLPYWKPTMPLYSYLYGMKAFGLVETQRFNDAEKAARRGLELQRKDAWSTHALAHVLEIGGRPDEGLTFLSTTVQDWEPCGMLACHNFWHWALYHIEKGEYQGALDIYDSQVGERVKSGAMLDIVDACSLLYRLQMEGVNIGERWQDMAEICRPHLDDHLMAFNDIHLLMSCLGVKKKEDTEYMMKSLREFVKNGSGTNHKVTKEVGLALCESFVAFDAGEYAKAVDILAPVRYEILKIGGSDAQRELFNQFLIHAGMRSSKPEHNKLARSLLYEKKALKESSCLTDRLLAKAMMAHAD